MKSAVHVVFGILLMVFVYHVALETFVIETPAVAFWPPQTIVPFPQDDMVFKMRNFIFLIPQSDSDYMQVTDSYFESLYITFSYVHIQFYVN